MTPKLTTDPEQRIAVFGGSFNPFTVGHASVVERGLKLFDKIIVAIGINRDKQPGCAEIAARCDAIARLYSGNPRVSVEAWDGLMVDLAKARGAAFMLRGVRSAADFEYERSMADINRQLSGIETVLLYTLPQHAAVSSSVVRELQSYGVDVTQFLPSSQNTQTK